MNEGLGDILTTRNGIPIDARRYMTDTSYRMAIMAQDADLLAAIDEGERWLWDLTGTVPCPTVNCPSTPAPNVAMQHYGFNNQGAPLNYKPAVMGRWLMERRQMVMGTDGAIYGSGVGDRLGLYVPCEQWIRKMVQDSLDEDYTRGREDVIDWIEVELASKPVDFTVGLPGGLINVKNGLLDPTTGKLLDHDPNFISSYQIPVAWVDGATCPGFDKFIREASEDEDTVELIWQIIGYTLFGNGERQKFFILRGPGGNGKSVLLWVLTNLIGRGFISSNSLAELCDNQWRAAELYGKRANICGDIGKEAVKGTDLLKKLTGGFDMITVEQKYRNPFDFINRAVLVFSANEDPVVLDKTQGMDDRPLFVSMPVRFRGTPGERPEIFHELVQRDELEGILVKAAAAYRRLEENRDFILPEASARLKDEWRGSNSSAIRFWRSCIQVVDDRTVKKVTAAQVYQRYYEWCFGNNLKNKMGKKSFWDDIDKVCPNVGLRVITNDGTRYLWGIIPIEEEGLLAG